MTLIRKQVQITSKQEEFLKARVEETEGLKESMIIRAALKMYMDNWNKLPKDKRGEV